MLTLKRFIRKILNLFDRLALFFVFGPTFMLFIYNIVAIEQHTGWFCSMCIYTFLKVTFNELCTLPLSMLGVIAIVLYKGYGYVYVTLMDLEDWLLESTMRKLKHRYLEFLLKRLIINVDYFDSKYLRRHEGINESYCDLKDLQYAYDGICREINIFRQDMRKVFYPNQWESKQVPELIYGLTQQEIAYVENSKWARLPVRTDYEFIQHLIEP